MSSQVTARIKEQRIWYKRGSHTVGVFQNERPLAGMCTCFLCNHATVMGSCPCAAGRGLQGNGKWLRKERRFDAETGQDLQCRRTPDGP